MSDELLELPDGWEWTTLGELCEIARGGSPRPIKEFLTNAPDGVNWIKISDASASSKYIYETKEKIKVEGIRYSRLVNEGDFLLSNSMSFGRPYIMRTSGCIHDGWLVLKNKYGLFYQDYLYYFLSSNTTYHQFDQLASGSTVRNLNIDLAKEVKVSLPPLNEQKRIVAKIEELNDRTQKAKEALEAIPQLCDRFRQSVLAAAFRGDLTADWREQNPDVEPASVLLERIRKERCKLKQTEVQINELPDIPETWMWSTLDQCFDLERGRFSIRPRNDPSCYNGAYPFVQIGDLPREGGIIETYSQTLNEKGLSVSKMFPKGCVLIAIVGATIGNTGILSFDSCCPDSLVAIRSNNFELLQYIEYYMRSRKLAIRSASYASGGQPNINLQSLNPYPFPVPPYEEILEINERLTKFNRFTEIIKQQIIQTKIQADQLNQSILSKAFRGELVPQDPDDEPASVLLERIRAEREKLNNTKSKTKRTSKPKSKTPEGQETIPGLE